MEASAPQPSMGRAVIISAIVAAVVSAVVAVGMSYALQPASPAPQTLDFYVMTIALAFNDTAVGIPHDAFVPDLIVVNRGATLRIHFYNTEDKPEAHTFTMAAPYAVDHVLDMLENVTFTISATTAGVFAYRCTIHQPSMTGYLVVQG